MTNAGPEALTNLSYRFQRGPGAGTEADVRQELAEPSEPNEQVQSTFTPMPGDLAGRRLGAVHLHRIDHRPATAWPSARPGVYPLMVNVNGAVALEDGPLEARIGELHLLLTVMGVPGGTGPGTAGSADPGSGRTRADRAAAGERRLAAGRPPAPRRRRHLPRRGPAGRDRARAVDWPRWSTG